MTDVIDRWCILRMSSGSTLQVARSLAEAGYQVWTPVETLKRRAPRSKVTREVTLPIMPGIVFAEAGRVQDLAALSHAPSLTYLRWNSETKRMEMHGCPYFSLFKYDGRYPLVADRHLDPLRQAEHRGRPRSQGPLLAVGDAVRHPAGMLGGLVGVVIKAHRKKAVVLFGSLEVEIEMSDLLPVKTAA